jgi:hypothetical protein
MALAMHGRCKNTQISVTCATFVVVVNKQQFPNLILKKFTIFVLLCMEGMP